MEESEKSDVAAAIAGDEEALKRLLVSIGPRLERRINRKLETCRFDDFSTRDVLQEVYLKVAQRIDEFDLQRIDKWNAWLNKVADNQINDMLRERNRRKRGGDARFEKKPADSASSAMSLSEFVADKKKNGEYRTTASQALMRNEIAEMLLARITELPDNQRAAITYYHIEDRSLADTAELMECTSDAVRGYVHRGMKALKDLLGKESSIWFPKQ